MLGSWDIDDVSEQDGRFELYTHVLERRVRVAREVEYSGEDVVGYGRGGDGGKVD